MMMKSRDLEFVKDTQERGGEVGEEEQKTQQKNTIWGG